MKAQLSKLRRVLFGVAVVTAFAATPTVVDAGSSSGTVRIVGNGFVPYDCWFLCDLAVARVQIYNPYDAAFVEDQVTMDEAGSWVSWATCIGLARPGQNTLEWSGWAELSCD